MTKEDQLIERIQNRFPPALVRGKRAGDVRSSPLSVGIGDDAAVLSPRAGTEWVVTTDAFLEKVHFLRTVHLAKAVGYKALARATSDIAAMGASPRYFFLTIGIPAACAGAWLDDLLEGMSRAAGQFGLVLAGGDTTKYSTIVISLTVVGEVNRGMAILRSGAVPGDMLCVSGRLGEAELGWQLVRRKLHRRKSCAALLKKHFYPEPRLTLGKWLAAHRYATSMIDTSDGLSTDLGHVCKASGVGAKVWASNIPAVRIPRKLQRLGLDPLSLALNGGDDYELLFTVPKKVAGRLPSKIDGIPVTVIGEITREKKVVLVGTDGHCSALQPKGWDPFRKSKKI